jgi:predicted Zn-ribbon and HTH transcriptional regulator
MRDSLRWRSILVQFLIGLLAGYFISFCLQAIVYHLLEVLGIVSRDKVIALDSLTSPIFGIVAAVILAKKEFREQLEENNAKSQLCRKCGYDLRASSDRCPECGTIISVKDRELFRKS